MKSLLLPIVAMLVPIQLWAGAPYDTANGYAASGFDVVAYFDLAEGDAAVPGSQSLTVDHDGGTYAFATTSNRDAFVADPDAYLPAFDGHCAFGASRGFKTAGAPVFWRIVDGSLYLNGGSRANELWVADVEGNIELGNTNWVELEPQPAAEDLPLDFDVTSAPTD